ncbi:MAG: metallophosphoesterase [Fastidiosipilaceae bacterium]|jgi:predicted MPP superfamily phosphohydrolase|nr:hypothetical protein [Clostridiaceae bacterium]
MNKTISIVIIIVIILLFIWVNIEARLMRIVVSKINCQGGNENKSESPQQLFGSDKIASKNARPYAQVKGTVIYKGWSYCGVPESAETTKLRIVFISDLHSYFMRIPHRKIRTALKQSRPDLVLFGGDLSSGQWDRKYGLKQLKAIVSLCKNMGIPMYLVRGNHDDTLTNEQAYEHELDFLDNQSVVIYDRKSQPWLLLGLQDKTTANPDAAKALKQVINLPEDIAPNFESTQKFIEYIPPHRRIVLAHNPDTIFLLDPQTAGLILTGHFHGGQIRLPFRLEYRSLRGERLCREGIYEHHHQRNGVWGYITNGLGCVLFPFRFLSPPEFTVLDLETKDQ